MRLADSQDLIVAPVVALAALLRYAPEFARRAASATLASAAYRFSVAKRRSIEQALDRALEAGPSGVERRRIALGSMRGVWEELFTLAAGARGRPGYEPARVEGLDRLRETLARGRGAILWESNGFGRRWATKRLLKEAGFGLHQVHGALNLGGFDTLDPEGSWLRRRIVRPALYRWEGYFVEEIVQLRLDASLAPLRRMQEILESNGVLCVAADGLNGRRRLPTALLGHQLPLATGMVTLARSSGAALHPVFGEPLAEGGCRIEVEPAIELAADGSREHAARRTLARMANLLEARVRARPELYRNWNQLTREDLTERE